MSNPKTPLLLNTSKSFDQLKQRQNVFSPIMMNHFRRNEKLHSRMNRGLKTKENLNMDISLNSKESEEKYSKEKRKISLCIPDSGLPTPKLLVSSPLMTPQSMASTRPTTSKYKSTKILFPKIYKEDLIDLITDNLIEITEEEKKNNNVKLLVQRILDSRVEASNKIKNFLKLKRFQKNVKIFYLMKKIVHERRINMIKIQKNVRGHLVHKSIKKFMKMMEDNYTIFYYPDREDIYSVRMIIEQENYNRLFNLCYNQFLDCFYLFIHKQEYAKKKYKFNFVVNDRIIIDTNFDVTVDSDGKFFNVLDFDLLKSKGYILNLKEHQDIHRLLMPKRKMTHSFLDGTSSFEIDKNDFRNLKPCLRKSFDNLMGSPKKKVSFNLVVNYCD